MVVHAIKLICAGIALAGPIFESLSVRPDSDWWLTHTFFAIHNLSVRTWLESCATLPLGGYWVVLCFGCFRFSGAHYDMFHIRADGVLLCEILSIVCDWVCIHIAGWCGARVSWFIVITRMPASCNMDIMCFMFKYIVKQRQSSIRANKHERCFNIYTSLFVVCAKIYLQSPHWRRLSRCWRGEKIFEHCFEVYIRSRVYNQAKAKALWMMVEYKCVLKCRISGHIHIYDLDSWYFPHSISTSIWIAIINKTIWTKSQLRLHQFMTRVSKLDIVEICDLL